MTEEVKTEEQKGKEEVKKVRKFKVNMRRKLLESYVKEKERYVNRKKQMSEMPTIELPATACPVQRPPPPSSGIVKRSITCLPIIRSKPPSKRPMLLSISESPKTFVDHHRLDHSTRSALGKSSRNQSLKAPEVYSPQGINRYILPLLQKKSNLKIFKSL